MSKQFFIAETLTSVNEGTFSGIFDGASVRPVLDTDVSSLGLSPEVSDYPVFKKPDDADSLISLTAIYSLRPGFEDCSMDEGYREIRETSLWVLCHGKTASLMDDICYMEKLASGEIEPEGGLLFAISRRRLQLAKILGADMMRFLLETIQSAAAEDEIQSFAIPLLVDSSKFMSEPRDTYERQSWLTDEAAEAVFSYYVGVNTSVMDIPAPNASEASVVYFEA